MCSTSSRSATSTWGPWRTRASTPSTARRGLARRDPASDADYASIEGVIAHEYFHNWSGDRVTCRDWFQLCLKEGRPVSRDQGFPGDPRSGPVERIAAVRMLKTHQFPEDAGPLAHP